MRGRAIRLGALAATALVACAVAAAPAAAATRSIALTIRFDDGAGKVAKGTLTCRPGERRATGVARPAAKSCARVRAIAGFLRRQPRADRVCTLIYGGPQTVRVTGRIDGKRVDRRFARKDGCEIADYERLARALPAVRVK